MQRAHSTMNFPAHSRFSDSGEDRSRLPEKMRPSDIVLLNRKDVFYMCVLVLSQASQNLGGLTRGLVRLWVSRRPSPSIL